MIVRNATLDIALRWRGSLHSGSGSFVASFLFEFPKTGFAISVSRTDSCSGLAVREHGGRTWHDCYCTDFRDISV
jgi:hypothetical protein